MTYSLYATCSTPGRQLQTFDLKNRVWGNEYETSLMTKLVAKHLGIPLGGSPTGALTVSAVKSLGKMQVARIIGQTVNTFRIKGSLELRIATTEDRFIRHDIHTGRTFLFMGSPTTNTMVEFLLHLDKIGLNKMGPLSDISMCLSEWMGAAVDDRHIAMMTFKY